MNLLVRLIRFIDYGSFHKSILGRFFLFFCLNNLIGITVGGSIITVFQFLSTGDVAQVFSVIAVSIPKQSPFFVNYVLLLGIVGNAFYLAKPLVVLVRWISLRCCKRLKKDFAFDGFYFKKKKRFTLQAYSA